MDRIFNSDTHVAIYENSPHHGTAQPVLECVPRGLLGGEGDTC